MVADEKKIKDDFLEVWNDIEASLPQTLATIRERKQISQRDMAKFLDVNHSTLSKVEQGNGTITAKILIGYAFICDYPLEKLLSIKGPGIDPKLEKVICELVGKEGQHIIAGTLEELKRLKQ